MNKIAITTGDPNGIGAEITIKALNKLKIDSDKVVIISNKEVLDYYGKLDIPYEIRKERVIKRDNITSMEFDLRDDASIEYDKSKFDYITILLYLYI